MRCPFIRLTSKRSVGESSLPRWSHLINVNNITRVTTDHETGDTSVLFSGDNEEKEYLPVHETGEEIEKKILWVFENDEVSEFKDPGPGYDTPPKLTWINVSEQLPRDGSYCLVCLKKIGGIQMDTYRNGKFIWYLDDVIYWAYQNDNGT